jgi:tRNA A22 N-methylase
MAHHEGRLDAITQLLPDLAPIIDVGADHGNIAKLIGAFPTERQHHRISGNEQLFWTVCDGLSCFRAIGSAVIAGMGARKIMAILADGPTMTSAVLHAADKPHELRTLLAEAGWRILNETITRRPTGFDEILIAAPGAETSSGLTLYYGPHLLQRRSTVMIAHMEQEKKRLSKILSSAPNGTDAHISAQRHQDFVTRWLDGGTAPTLH